MTANFIDVDELEDSIDHLQGCHNLRDLYLMGNPAQASWDKFNSYIIAKLPQLVNLDGTEITKSMRIIATQQLPTMEYELRQLAAIKRGENELKRLQQASALIAQSKEPSKKSNESVQVEDVNSDTEGDHNEDEELTENTPETRVKVTLCTIYLILVLYMYRMV
jgi:protein TilB